MGAIVSDVTKSLIKQANYIGGEWILSHQWISVFDPTSGDKVGEIPSLEQPQIDRAIEEAHEAFQSWRKLCAYERAEHLERWLRLIEAQEHSLAELIVLEQGKPLKEAKGEVQYAQDYIRWFIEEGKRTYGRTIPTASASHRLMTIQQPVGVCALITPWNFPLAMLARKIAPALMAGCTIVAKPSEETPFSALALAYFAEKAGLPDGVLNMVTGNPESIGEAFCANPLVRKVSFTGSTRVGQWLMKHSAQTLKRLSLELGGNAPFIVFGDADIEKAVDGLMKSKFRNAGQTCVSANRIYLHHSVKSRFLDQLRQKMKEIRLGSGLDDHCDQGPLINEAAIKKVEAMIQDAVDKGASVMEGGKVDEKGALFFQPTLVDGTNETMRIFQEEVFGPVIAVQEFTDETDVVRWANQVDAGLAAYIYTNNIDRIYRVAEQLECGMLGINEGSVSTVMAPFGGVKFSGLGREGGTEGIEEYMESKMMNFKIDTTP
ncbi:NAD-dependent succinate-semialdehyde dehydrogenase [Algicola sagamiensis]|uniref:NAD-dependent succinate-semialdehyde dehydrogenase n=1 Tax=Algicola sagamiensis TaxID=163869 RepID=UPI00037F8A46|nr:NAD-dependent succinate-semialdehyde dehydrogenase [Algicola sagamiensis]